MSHIIRKMLFLAIILIVCGVSKGAVFKVGDSNGWNGHVDYKSWSASKQFHVGDTILFEYKKEFQNVVRVTHKNYRVCNATAPYGTWTSGNDSFTIPKAGHYFFISSLPNQCQSGQKVDIRVPATQAPKASPPRSPTPSPRSPTPHSGVAPKASPPQSPTPSPRSPTPHSSVAPKASPIQSPTPHSGIAPKASPIQSPTRIAPKASPIQSPTPHSSVAPTQSPPPSGLAPKAAPMQSPGPSTGSAPSSSEVPSDQPLTPAPAPASSATSSLTKKYSFFVAAIVAFFCV